MVKPLIIGFLCNWCSYEAADSAGRAREVYPPSLRIVRLMCSGRLDPAFILEAFKEGADGVMIIGCPPGECHYKDGNYQALKKYMLLRKILPEFGIPKERFRLVGVAASEPERFAKAVYDMAETLNGLGPLHDDILSKKESPDFHDLVTDPVI